MKKLFVYELRRMVISKFFVAILIILGVYGWQTLSSVTILGVANTAPFSPWSFGSYVSRLLPIALLALLLSLSTFFTGAARDAQPVLEATPVDPRAYLAVRVLAAVAAFCTACIVPLCLGGWFLHRMFGFTAFGTLILPVLLVMIPAILLVTGIGLLAGQRSVLLLYGLMLLMLVLSQLTLPQAVDFTGRWFFEAYARTLPPGIDGERAFFIPAGEWAVRGVISLVGLCCLLWAIRSADSKVHRISG